MVKTNFRFTSLGIKVIVLPHSMARHKTGNRLCMPGCCADSKEMFWNFPLSFSFLFPFPFLFLFFFLFLCFFFLFFFSFFSFLSFSSFLILKDSDCMEGIPNWVLYAEERSSHFIIRATPYHYYISSTEELCISSNNLMWAKGLCGSTNCKAWCVLTKEVLTETL